MLCIGYAKSAPDEGFFAAETTPHPSRCSLRSHHATLSHKGRGEGVAAYPARAAFLR